MLSEINQLSSKTVPTSDATYSNKSSFFRSTRGWWDIRWVALLRALAWAKTRNTQIFFYFTRNIIPYNIFFSVFLFYQHNINSKRALAKNSKKIKTIFYVQAFCRFHSFSTWKVDKIKIVHFPQKTSSYSCYCSIFPRIYPVAFLLFCCLCWI